MADPNIGDVFDEFVDAAEQLRQEDGVLRITAHTSSVAIDEWGTDR